MNELEWAKCTGDRWCDFMALDLEPVVLQRHGVYIIWHDGSNHRGPEIVRVGQGDIADRIAAHRGDEEITRYENRGRLFVTWAAVPARSRDGVERYLFDKLVPLAGQRAPDARRPVPVNLPWPQ